MELTQMVVKKLLKNQQDEINAQEDRFFNARAIHHRHGDSGTLAS